MTTTRLYLLHARSPLHAGVGEGVGAINLPIARERMSGFPYLPGSSVKGVLRDAAERAQGKDDPAVLTAFGPPTDRAADARGGVVFSDASLLCLPVRSLLGTFAWVTAPVVLARLHRDAAEAGVAIPGLEALVASRTTLTTQGSALLTGDEQHRQLYLEDLLFPAFQAESAEATRCARWLAAQLWPETASDALARHAQDFFVHRFLVVTDDVFGFLSRTAIEVRSRVKINDETGTAAQSGPWQEEALPTEALLHGLLQGRATRLFRVTRDQHGKSARRDDRDSGEARDARQALEAFLGLPRGVLRFGGKASIGMGRAQLQVVGS